MVQQAHAKLEESKSLYGQAQTLLENELNINIESDKSPNVNIKTLSQSFFTSGRLDAEHYQEKYDRVENAIKGYKGGWKTIEQLRTFNARGTQPVYVEGGTLDVINSKHILEDGLDYDNFEKTAASAWDSERSRVYPGDILIYTTGANIGRTATYLKQEKAVASNHVNILRTEGYDSVCLGFILNSPLGRLQTEKKCSGSAQAELYPKEIDGFLVPILPASLQNQISALVQKSFALKAESIQLLEAAKTMIEREIEK